MFISLQLSVNVCGKRTRKGGLVVPGCYRARTSRKNVQKLRLDKERYMYFEVEIEQDATVFLAKQARN